jgi:uncharacterized membrane protein
MKKRKKERLMWFLYILAWIMGLSAIVALIFGILRNLGVL